MNLRSETWATFYVTGADLRNMEAVQQKYLDAITSQTQGFDYILETITTTLKIKGTAKVLALLGGATLLQHANTLANLSVGYVRWLDSEDKKREIEVIRSGRNIAGHLAGIIEKNKYKQIEVTLRMRKYFNPEIGTYTTLLYGNPNEAPAKSSAFQIKRAQLSNGVWQGK